MSEISSCDHTLIFLGQLTPEALIWSQQEFPLEKKENKICPKQFCFLTQKVFKSPTSSPIFIQAKCLVTSQENIKAMHRTAIKRRKLAYHSKLNHDRDHPTPLNLQRIPALLMLALASPGCSRFLPNVTHTTLTPQPALPPESVATLPLQQHHKWQMSSNYGAWVRREGSHMPRSWNDFQTLGKLCRGGV